MYAHNGWRFDFLGLWSVDEIKQAEKIDRKGRILVCTIDGIECRDYKAIVAEPLSKIGEALGYPKGITPMKFKMGTVSEEGITDEDIKYCLLDVEILSKAVLSLERTFQQWCHSPVPLELPLTTASMAYRVWSARFWPEHWFFLNKKGKRAKGTLFNEMSYDIEKTTTGVKFKMDFGNADEYWEFVDQGVQGAGGFKGSGKK